MTELTPDRFARKSDDDLLILDVRPEEAYEEWNVPGSVNVDIYDELQADSDAAKAVLADRVDGDEVLEERADADEIVTVCAAGIVAERATELLREMGYDAKTLVDGMDGWARVHRSAPIEADIDGDLVQVARPGTGCLSHLPVSDGEAAVFEPSQYAGEYDALLEEYDAELVGVFDTHAHADHVSGGRTLAARHDVPYYLHPADTSGDEATPVVDGDVVAVGDVEIEVVHTPGHSPGSVSYAIKDEALLTGDTLFHESVGRVELGVEAGIEETDVEENAETLYESLERLRSREGDPLVLPAHDPGSPRPPVAARLSEVEARNDAFGQDRDALVEALSETAPEQPPNFERIKLVNVGEEAVTEKEATDLELGPNRCAAE